MIVFDISDFFEDVDVDSKGYNWLYGRIFFLSLVDGLMVDFVISLIGDYFFCFFGYFLKVFRGDYDGDI